MSSLRTLKPIDAIVTKAMPLRAWIAQLDSDDFETRETADRTLRRLRAVTEAPLRAARGKAISLELSRRIDRLLDDLNRDMTGEELQAIRAVEVLERIATPPARKLLVTLAQGEPAVVLTRKARAALGRVKR